MPRTEELFGQWPLPRFHPAGPRDTLSSTWFKDWCVGFRVWGSGSRIWGLGFWVSGAAYGAGVGLGGVLVGEHIVFSMFSFQADGGIHPTGVRTPKFT